MRVQNYPQTHQVMLEQEGSMRATVASCAKVGVIVPLVFLTGKLSVRWQERLVGLSLPNRIQRPNKSSLKVTVRSLDNR